jgi:hypothetical protein
MTDSASPWAVNDRCAAHVGVGGGFHRDLPLWFLCCSRSKRYLRFRVRSVAGLQPCRFIIGSNSRAEFDTCGDVGEPDVYTDVSYYVPWILSVIDSEPGYTAAVPSA